MDIVYKEVTGTGNATLTFADQVTGLFLTNDGNADLTVAIGEAEGVVTLTLKPNEKFPGTSGHPALFAPFVTLTVTATGAYHGFVTQMQK